MSNRAGGLGLFDIYASTLADDGTFGPPVLVLELSSSANDVLPAVRRDGLEALITSNRAGGQGLNDLWVATRASTSDPWSTPANLGPIVNSSANEQRSAISSDGRTIIFFSDRPGGFGAFDLYQSTRNKVKGADD